MYVIPGTGVGGGAGPRQGMTKSELLHPASEQAKAEPAVSSPAFQMNWRLLSKVVGRPAIAY